MTVTTLISEQEGYYLKSAEAPNGDVVTLRVPILPAPSIEQARMAFREVDYYHSILGATYSMMGGTTEQRCYSLKQVAAFLQMPEDILDPYEGQHGTIGVVDFALLSDWIDDIIGDRDLSGAIRELIGQESTLGKVLPFIKELLQERIISYQQCLAGDVIEAGEEPDNKGGTGLVSRDGASDIDGDLNR